MALIFFCDVSINTCIYHLHLGPSLRTVNHILIECPQFNHLHQQYHFGSTLKDLFNKIPVLTI